MKSKIKYLIGVASGITSLIPTAVLAHADEYHEPVSSVETSTAVGLGLVFIILLILIIAGLVIFSLVFWIMMLLHLAKNDIPDKETWLIILIVSFFLSMPLIGAVAYYFVVKRNFEQKSKKLRPNTNSRKRKKANTRK